MYRPYTPKTSGKVYIPTGGEYSYTHLGTVVYSLYTYLGSHVTKCVWANSPMLAHNKKASITDHLRLLAFVHALGDQSPQPERVKSVDSF